MRAVEVEREVHHGFTRVVRSKSRKCQLSLVSPVLSGESNAHWRIAAPNGGGVRKTFGGLARCQWACLSLWSPTPKGTASHAPATLCMPPASPALPVPGRWACCHGDTADVHVYEPMMLLHANASKIPTPSGCFRSPISGLLDLSNILRVLGFPYRTSAASQSRRCRVKPVLVFGDLAKLNHTRAMILLALHARPPWHGPPKRAECTRSISMETTGDWAVS